MGKLTIWYLAITLLFSWCWPVYGFDSLPKYRDLGLHKEDAGEIALFLLYIVICEVGKKLDKGYICPVNCGAQHIHRYYEIKKSNIQTIDGLHRSDGDSTQEQSASSLRHSAGI